MIYPNLTHWPSIGGGFRQRYGIPAIMARWQEPIRSARGHRAHDGRFEPDEHGSQWLVFPQFHDVLFWNPASNEFATWNGKAFALGEDMIEDAPTCALYFSLNIFESPWTWLRAGCDGIVITDWGQAFDKLRDVPRIAIEASILAIYKKAMVPKRMPRVFVIEATRTAA